MRLHEILAEKGKPSCQLGKALEIVRVLGMKLEIHGSRTPWSMVRERIREWCERVIDAIGDGRRLPELRTGSVREIVTQRAARMLDLTDKAGG